MNTSKLSAAVSGAGLPRPETITESEAPDSDDQKQRRISAVRHSRDERILLFVFVFVLVDLAGRIVDLVVVGVRNTSAGREKRREKPCTHATCGAKLNPMRTTEKLEAFLVEIDEKVLKRQPKVGVTSAEMYDV
jgi:hypothetical protein